MKPVDPLPTFLYLGIVVMSLGAGGATSEACTIGGCGSRPIAFIVFSFLASVFSCFSLALYVDEGCLNAFSIEKFEIILTPGVVLCSLIATSISTSPRSNLPVLYALLAWFSFISSTAALLLAFNKSMGKQKKHDPDSLKTPLTEVVSETTNATSLQPPEYAPPMPPAPTS